jgi:hypothetical protein
MQSEPNSSKIKDFHFRNTNRFNCGRMTDDQVRTEMEIPNRSVFQQLFDFARHRARILNAQQNETGQRIAKRRNEEINVLDRGDDQVISSQSLSSLKDGP